MNKLHKNNKGFSTIEIAVAIVIVVLIGVAGWLVYKNHHKATAPSTISTKVKTTKDESKNTATANAGQTVTTLPSSVYGGWKTYCDTATNECFDYPVGWTQATYSYTTFSLKSPDGSVELDYTNPYNNSEGGQGSYYVADIEPLAITNSSYKVVGGYFTSNNEPGYYLLDSTMVKNTSMTVGQTASNVALGPGYTNKNNNNRGQLTAYYSPPTAPYPTAQANAWFSTSNAKTTLLIMESFYYK